MNRNEVSEILRRLIPDIKPQVLSIAADQIMRLAERERSVRKIKRR